MLDQASAVTHTRFQGDYDGYCASAFIQSIHSLRENRQLESIFVTISIRIFDHCFEAGIIGINEVDSSVFTDLL